MISLIITIINLLISLAILYVLLDSNISKRATSVTSAINKPFEQPAEGGQELIANEKYKHALFNIPAMEKNDLPSRLSSKKGNSKEAAQKKNASSLNEDIDDLKVGSTLQARLVSASQLRDYHDNSMLKEKDALVSSLSSSPLKSDLRREDEDVVKSSFDLRDELKKSEYEEDLGSSSLMGKKLV